MPKVNVKQLVVEGVYMADGARKSLPRQVRFRGAPDELAAFIRAVQGAEALNLYHYPEEPAPGSRVARLPGSADGRYARMTIDDRGKVGRSAGGSIAVDQGPASGGK